MIERQWVLLTLGRQLVLEADVESGVSMGRERHACLSNKVLRSAVLVAYCIFDLAADVSKIAV